METSVVRKRIGETIEKAKRTAADRRQRTDEGSRTYALFLDTVGIPLFRQVAGVLKASGYPFSVFTPAGGVRLMSERTAEDFIELSLEASGEQPMVFGHVSRARGRRVIESERPVAEVSVAYLTEDHLLDFLLKELEPFVER